MISDPITVGCWGQNTPRIPKEEAYATLYLQALVNMPLVTTLYLQALVNMPLVTTLYLQALVNMPLVTTVYLQAP